MVDLLIFQSGCDFLGHIVVAGKLHPEVPEVGHSFKPQAAYAQLELKTYLSKKLKNLH